MAKNRPVKNVASALVAREVALGHGKKLAATAKPGRVGGAIDTLAGTISPAWANSRRTARMAGLIGSGGYDITKSSRTRRGKKKGSGGSADSSQDDRTLWDLREICRDHDRNSTLLHGIIDRVADNVAGPEYGFRPDSDDEKFNADAAEILTEASAAAEYRGLFNLQEIIYTGFRSLMPDGDFLMLHLENGKVQIIEAHDLVSPMNGKGYKDRKIVGGVEIDGEGRHSAYYIRTPESESRWGTYNAWVSDYKKAKRIEAVNVQHTANRHRFSQTRGVPILAACLDIFDRLDDYLEAEMMAAKLNANLGWFIQREATGESLPGTEAVTDANSSSDSETTYDRLMRSEPGQIMDLLPGESVNVIGAKRPGDTFEPYIATVLRMVGAGIGIPLELVLLDFSKTTYSSARAALLQAYRTFMRQQVFCRNNIIQPYYNHQMSRWIASGDLRPVKNAYRLKYFPPRWAWIDPLKRVLALTKKIAAGAGTLEDWVADEGRTMEEIFNVREKELKIMVAKKIPSTTAPDNLKPLSGERKNKNG